MQPGQRSYRRYHRRIPQSRPLRTRPALGLAVITAVIIAAAITVFAVLKDDGTEAPPSTADGSTSVPAAAGDLPAAPWRTSAVPRPAVPPPYVTAWDRARNRTTCALLYPTDGGPELAGATATSGKTPEDKGWDIFLTGPAGSVEVLALFDKSTQTGKPTAIPSFTKTWADGSSAKYAPDEGNAVLGTGDPSSSPFEAVLTLPDQECAYRIYDSLGKAHLESLFARLRLMTP